MKEKKNVAISTHAHTRPEFFWEKRKYTQRWHLKKPTPNFGYYSSCCSAHPFCAIFGSGGKSSFTADLFRETSACPPAWMSLTLNRKDGNVHLTLFDGRWWSWRQYNNTMRFNFGFPFDYFTPVYNPLRMCERVCSVRKHKNVCISSRTQSVCDFYVVRKGVVKVETEIVLLPVCKILRGNNG